MGGPKILYEVDMNTRMYELKVMRIVVGIEQSEEEATVISHTRS